MQTVKHIERLWEARKYERLFRELIANRAEASLRLELELSSVIPAAAMALIRLDELSQSHVPLYAKLVRTLVATQDRDGGWGGGDPIATALCLRALMAGRGGGEAIERALAHLATLQKPEGLWPRVPFRRMPADPYVSAFILYQLGDAARFREAVRLKDAIDWFAAHESSLDRPTRDLWDRATLRCRSARPSYTSTLPSMAAAWS